MAEGGDPFMDESRVDPEGSLRRGAKPRWERPTLTFLGNLKELVQGAGKFSGSPNDSDMLNFNKSPGQG